MAQPACITNMQNLTGKASEPACTGTVQGLEKRLLLIATTHSPSPAALGQRRDLVQLSLVPSSVSIALILVWPKIATKHGIISGWA